MPDGPIITAAALTADRVDAVTDLVALAARDDGFSALNESAVLALTHPRAGVLHLLLQQGPDLVAYAQLDAGPGGSTGHQVVGQLVVHPGHRRRGLGSQLLASLVAASPARLHVWAMGSTSAARALAARAGLVVVRELLIMTRPLEEPPELTPTPEGVLVRSFVVGQDEDRWLSVNARAFASHPEQGQLTRADLLDRMAEPWFDPKGFLVAIRDGAMVGFHWTKQHPGALGEVYVLGVDPDAGGQGLGKALLSRGLDHLHTAGDTSVQLYVEADHAAAVGLYQRSGFTVKSRDVMYAQP
ncbi:MAG TPA: mycothiol synthase [Propionibacteriaceae bacterium]